MAIAFDASVSGPAGGAGPHTFALTTTGSDVVVIVGLLANGTASATYNGVSMDATGMPTESSSGYTVRTFFLAIGAGVGAQNVVATGGTATDIYPIAASYTGVAQAGIPDAIHNQLVATDAPWTITWTTIADNAWQYIFQYGVSGTASTAGSGTLMRQGNGFAGFQLFDSNAARTPAGSHNIEIATGPTGAKAVAAFSLAPATGGGPPALTLVGRSVLDYGAD